MKIKSRLDYIFAVGKIKILEKSLIRGETFAQALQLNVDAALRLLAESGFYGEELAQVKTSRQLEDFLERTLNNLKQMLRALLPDQVLWDYLQIGSLDDAAKLLSEYPSHFFEEYVKHLTDMHNISTFLRLRLLKELQDILVQKITQEGFIPKSVFVKYYHADLPAFIERLSRVSKYGQLIDYSHFLKAAMEKAVNEKSFAALEKAQADYLLGILRQTKRIPFGPEPVLGYFFARLNEIKLIRLLILGKMNNVGDEIIKERFNDVYA
jgi:V/A-type H+/Na+-transporting ATPase subunit C